MSAEVPSSRRLAAYEAAAARHERVTSMLMALVATLGLVAAFLGLVWMTNQLWESRVTVPVELLDVAAGDIPGPVVPGADPGQVAVEAVENLPREDRPEESVQETAPVAETVLEALAEVTADVDAAQPDDQVDTAGAKAPGGRRGQSGTGGQGPPGAGQQKRWILVYDQQMSLDEYARMLDHFRIELAVPVGSDELVYVSGVSSREPRRRTGSGSRESRLYWAWQSGPHRQADSQLLRRAGIDPGRRLVVQYIPPELERRLQELEIAYAGRPADQIAVTRFGVRRREGGFEFYVISQGYREKDRTTP